MGMSEEEKLNKILQAMEPEDRKRAEELVKVLEDKEAEQKKRKSNDSKEGIEK